MVTDGFSVMHLRSVGALKNLSCETNGGILVLYFIESIKAHLLSTVFLSYNNKFNLILNSKKKKHFLTIVSKFQAQISTNWHVN